MSINLSSMETSVNVPNKQEYRCFHNVLASNIFNCKFNLDDCIGDQVEVATEYHWSCVNYGKNTRIHCETLVLFSRRIFAVSIEYLAVELHNSSCVCFAILLEHAVSIAVYVHYMPCGFPKWWPSTWTLQGGLASIQSQTESSGARTDYGHGIHRESRHHSAATIGIERSCQSASGFDLQRLWQSIHFREWPFESCQIKETSRNSRQKSETTSEEHGGYPDRTTLLFAFQSNKAKQHDEDDASKVTPKESMAVEEVDDDEEVQDDDEDDEEWNDMDDGATVTSKRTCRCGVGSHYLYSQMLQRWKATHRYSAHRYNSRSVSSARSNQSISKRIWIIWPLRIVSFYQIVTTSLISLVSSSIWVGHVFLRLIKKNWSLILFD